MYIMNFLQNIQNNTTIIYVIIQIIVYNDNFFFTNKIDIFYY